MKLIKEESGEDWLYVKGIDGKNEIVNKKNFMKFPTEGNCSIRFGEVQKGLISYYQKLAMLKEEFFFWQIDKFSESGYKFKGKLTDIGVINTDPKGANKIKIRENSNINHAIPLDVSEDGKTTTVYVSDEIPHLTELFNKPKTTYRKLDLIKTYQTK
jgi:hypothetical protein